jgi:hypothetical protein
LPKQTFLVSALLAMLGATFLGFLGGALVMFFQLPSSELLGKSLLGARTWYDGEDSPSSPRELAAAPAVRTEVDRPDRTFDGFTLYACVGSSMPDRPGTQAFLINMRREVVHRWAIPFSRVFPSPAHLKTPVPDSGVCFFACHLCPNGDLLTVFNGQGKPVGCGLAKLDKDSKVLWAYPAAIHHDVHVAADGTIYTLLQETVNEMPPGLERIATPCDIDFVVLLSPEGKLLREPISILTAFQDTPYAALLDAVKWPVKRHHPPGGSTAPHVGYDYVMRDPLHTNSVRLLEGDLAAKFPLFKAGHVLVSIRGMGVLAMLDPESGKVVWAARGSWYAQHDAQFLDNGHLLLYDNLGVAMGSRVLEYDPQTQGLPWSYGGPPGAPFFSSERGGCQRLPNGNTLIINSEGGEMVEVTPSQEIVWSSYADGYVTTARRFAADQLHFLDGGIHVRP